MNYRHAFHAGNHLDVFKHAALIFVLEHLLQKSQPFAVLDTHAGVGVYDLGCEEAQKTREYELGVARVYPPGLASAPAYGAILEVMNPEGLAAYPGSPEITRRLMREQDRLIACDLHPKDADRLKRLYRRDPRIAVHHRDGYEAIGALLPPPERRGLVFIDPPYEVKDETTRLIQAINKALSRWPTGIIVAWYPIKDGSVGDALAEAAAATAWPKTLRAEFSPYPRNGVSLSGGGILVVNAPWKLDERLEALVAELAGRLGDGLSTRAVQWVTTP